MLIPRGSLSGVRVRTGYLPMYDSVHHNLTIYAL